MLQRPRSRIQGTQSSAIQRTQDYASDGVSRTTVLPPHDRRTWSSERQSSDEADESRAIESWGGGLADVMVRPRCRMRQSSAVESDGARRQRRRPIHMERSAVAMLIGMGFEAEHARAAVASHHTLDEAAEALLDRCGSFSSTGLAPFRRQAWLL